MERYPSQDLDDSTCTFTSMERYPSHDLDDSTCTLSSMERYPSHDLDDSTCAAQAGVAREGIKAVQLEPLATQSASSSITLSTVLFGEWLPSLIQRPRRRCQWCAPLLTSVAFLSFCPGVGGIFNIPSSVKRGDETKPTKLEAVASRNGVLMDFGCLQLERFEEQAITRHRMRPLMQRGCPRHPALDTQQE